MLQKANPRNSNLLVYVDGSIVPREEAKVSVFDSVVQGGDAVWEGIRVYDGKIFALDKHIRRLHESAKAMAFTDIPSKDAIRKALFKTLESNGMRDGVHIRLTLTRGKKITSGMDPRLNQSGSCLIILAEWKDPVYPSEGISLITASIRRNSPLCVDSKIHHNNLINNILAKIEANVAGADAALMLDLYGFASECNGVNIFMTKNGSLFTPFADSCLPGITRGIVMEIANEENIPCFEKNLSLTELYNADEVFVTGTMGELTKVKEIDKRVIENTSGVFLLESLSESFSKRTRSTGEPLPF